LQRRTFLQSSVLLPTLGSLPALAAAKSISTGETEVINAGIGGNNTVDLLARMDKDCLQHQPQLVILMVGTNDMNSRKYIPLADYEKNLQAMIDAIKKAKSKILLMNLLPVYEPYLMTRHKPEFYAPEGHSGRLAQMNALIKKVAGRNRIAFLDLHHIFQTVGNIGLDADSLLQNEANSNKTDGLHPTADGYRTIAIAVYQHLLDHDLVRERIVCFGDSITFGDGKPGGKNYPAYLKKLLS
jgi:lysophospholipase L1-like esterase